MKMQTWRVLGVVGVFVMLVSLSLATAAQEASSTIPIEMPPEKSVAGCTLEGYGPDAYWPGPDSWGYSGAVVAVNWYDISASGNQVLLGDDDYDGPFSIGFDFPWYGQVETQFYISSNGFISFGSGSSDLGNDCPLPNSNTPDSLIAMMWDDLDPGDTSDPIYYETFASCPVGSGNCLIVMYDDVCHYPGGTECDIAGTWEAILYENGDVLIQFYDAGLEEGSLSTTGIEGPASQFDDGLTYACNVGGSLTDNLAIKFYYPPPAPRFRGSYKDALSGLEWGGRITYTLFISNSGDLPALDSSIIDVIPAGTDYISGSLSCTSGSCWYDVGDDAVYWNGQVDLPSRAQMAHGGWLSRSKGTLRPTNLGVNRETEPGIYSHEGTHPSQLSILLCDDSCNLSPPNTCAQVALDNLGESYTQYWQDWTGCEAALNSGAYDLAIIDNACYFPSSTLFDAINTFLSGGGQVVVNSYDMDNLSSHAFWVNAGVVWLSDVTTVPPVYRWHPDHPTIDDWPTDPLSFNNLYIDDGDKFDVLAGTELLAGYSPSIQAGEGALALRQDGRAMVSGFCIDNLAQSDTNGNSVSDCIEVWQDGLEYMLQRSIANPVTITFVVDSYAIECGETIHNTAILTDSDPSASLQLDASLGPWQEVSPMPGSGAMDIVVEPWPAAFGGNDHTYVVGGYGLGDRAYEYDPLDDTWTTLTANPFTTINYPMDGCFGWDADGDPVIVMFPDATSSQTNLLAYDIADDAWYEWTLPAGFPGNGIWAHDIANDYQENVCYITGGASAPGGGDLTSFYAYHPDSNTLDVLADFTSPRAFHSSWYHQDLLCLAGGVDVDGYYLNSTQCYDFATGSWNLENADLGPLPQTIWGAGDGIRFYSDLQRTQWWIAGGFVAGSISGQSYYYDWQDGIWYNGGMMPFAVYRTEADVQNSRLHTVGGSTGGFTYMPYNQKRIRCEPASPNAPVLFEINNPEGDGEYLVDWGQATGATEYVLEEDDRASFSSPTTRYDGSGTQYSVTGQGPGIWYYRVRASNAGGDSPWSNIESVGVVPNTPTLLPIDNADGDGDFLVDWNDVPDADDYALEEDNNAAFSSPTTCYSGSGSQYSATDHDAGTWHYRVRASNDAGNSTWSPAQSVTVEQLGPMSVYLPLVLRNFFEDHTEPNDSFEQAWGPLVSGQTYHGYFVLKSDDNDFYYMDLPAAHSIEIWLTDIPAGDDYALYLYDAAHGRVGYSDEYNADEHIFVPTAAANRYYVRVEPVVSAGQTQPYTLRVVFE